MAEAPPPRSPGDPGGDRPQRPSGDRPEYKVYRSGSGTSLGAGIGGSLRGLRGKLPGGGPSRPKGPRQARPGAAPTENGSRFTPKRVIVAALVLTVGWVLLSAVLFFVSAQTTKGVTGETEDALASGGPLLTGSTILVLGSDARTVPGEEGEVGRADSILLLHVALGSVRRLSILRDSRAEIPGSTPQKINAAYAIGGPPLMIDTVEQFLGNDIEINHLIEVDFQDFPKLIDAIGGVTVNNKTDLKAALFDKAVAAPEDCTPEGEGHTGEFRVTKGECKLDGDQALTYARIRKNLADPGEDDTERAARQQAVLTGIRGSLLSPGAFIRLPWIAWAAPRTVRTDLRGLGMSLLALDTLTGGTGKTDVLGDSANIVAGTSDILVSEVEKADAVERLLGK